MIEDFRIINYSVNAKNEIYRGYIVGYNYDRNSYTVRLANGAIMNDVPLIVDDGVLSVGTQVYLKNPMGDLNRLVIIGFGKVSEPTNEVVDLPETYPVGTYGIFDPNSLLDGNPKRIKINTDRKDIFHIHINVGRSWRFPSVLYYDNIPDFSELYNIDYVLFNQKKRSLPKQTKEFINYIDVNKFKDRIKYPYLYFNHIRINVDKPKDYPVVWKEKSSYTNPKMYTSYNDTMYLVYFSDNTGPIFLTKDTLFVHGGKYNIPHPTFLKNQTGLLINSFFNVVRDIKEDKISEMALYGFDAIIRSFYIINEHEQVILSTTVYDLNTGKRIKYHLGGTFPVMSKDINQIRLIDHGLYEDYIPYLVYSIEFRDDRASHYSVSSSTNRPPIAYSHLLAIGSPNGAKYYYADLGYPTGLDNGEGVWGFPGSFSTYSSSYKYENNKFIPIISLIIKGYIGGNGTDCLYPFRIPYDLSINYNYKSYIYSNNYEYFYKNWKQDPYPTPCSRCCMGNNVNPQTLEDLLMEESDPMLGNFSVINNICYGLNKDYLVPYYIDRFSFPDKYRDIYYKYIGEINKLFKLKDKFIVDYSALSPPGETLYYNYYSYQWKDALGWHDSSGYGCYFYAPFGYNRDYEDWNTYGSVLGEIFYSHIKLPFNLWDLHSSLAYSNSAPAVFGIELKDKTYIYESAPYLLHKHVKDIYGVGNDLPEINRNYNDMVVNVLLIGKVGEVKVIEYNKLKNIRKEIIYKNVYGFLYKVNTNNAGLWFNPQKDIDDLLDDGFEWWEILMLMKSPVLAIDFIDVDTGKRLKTVILHTNGQEVNRFTEESMNKYGIPQATSIDFELFDVTKDHILLINEGHDINFASSFAYLLYIPLKNIFSTNNLIQDHAYSYYDTDKNLKTTFNYQGDIKVNPRTGIRYFDIQYADGTIYKPE